MQNNHKDEVQQLPGITWTAVQKIKNKKLPGERWPTTISKGHHKSSVILLWHQKLIPCKTNKRTCVHSKGKKIHEIAEKQITSTTAKESETESQGPWAQACLFGCKGDTSEVQGRSMWTTAQSSLSPTNPKNAIYSPWTERIWLIYSRMNAPFWASIVSSVILVQKVCIHVLKG